MFDSLVVLKRERALGRLVWTLPVSVAFHATVVALLLLYSVFAPESLRPPCDVFLHAPALVVPVQLGGFQSEPQQPEEPARAQAAALDPRRLVEPDPESDTDDPLGNLERPTYAGGGPPGDGPWGPGSPDGLASGGSPEGPDTNAVRPGFPDRVVLMEIGKVSALRAVSEAQPAYPAALMNLRLAGRVELELVVDENGRVESVTILSATHPLFAEAAAAAVRTWRYHPPVSGEGARVAVMRRVVVNFSPR